MGNILDETFEEMLTRDPSILDAVKGCRQKCWMTCTVAPEMRRKLLLFALRVTWAKIGHHLRRLVGSK